MNKDILGLMKYITLVLLAPILSFGFAFLTFYIGMCIEEVIEFDFFIDNLIFVIPICFVLSPFVFLVVVPTIFAIKNYWSKYLDWFFDHKLLMTLLMPIIFPIIFLYICDSENHLLQVLSSIFVFPDLIIIAIFFAIFTAAFVEVKKKKKKEIFFYTLFCILMILIFALTILGANELTNTCFIISLCFGFCYLIVYLTVMGYAVFHLYT